MGVDWLRRAAHGSARIRPTLVPRAAVRDRAREEDGSILVLTAVSLVMLLGITALAVDVGYMFDARNRMAAAADVAARSAAMARGSAGCTCTPTPTPCPTLTNFGQDAVIQSGFSAANVTINYPPSSGPFAADCNYVEALVSRSVPTFFRRVLGTNAMTVGARAVAGGSNDVFPCIVTLDTAPSTGQGLSMTAGPVTMPGCTIQINASGTQGLNITSSYLDVTGPPDGEVYVNGACRQANCSSALVKPFNSALHANQNTTWPDPLGPSGTNVPAPWDSATDPCTGASVGQTKTDTAGHSYIVRSTARWTTTGVTLQPGIYCGGISLGGGTTNFATGIYILYGASGSHQSFSTNTSGSINPIVGGVDPPGVMFYATGSTVVGNAWRFPDQCMLQINPSGTVNFKAMTTGTWRGILFFQDRLWASSQNSQITGGGSTNLEGIIYIPNTSSVDPTIRFSGGSGGSWVDYTLLFVPSMVFTGGSVLKNNQTALSATSSTDYRIAE